MIIGRKPKSNITLMNTIFFRDRVETERGPRYTEYLDIVYKDCNTGKKFMQEIANPDYEYYLIKPDKVKPYPQLYVPEEDIITRTVPNNQLLKEIAKDTGNERFFNENNRSGERQKNQELHTHPAVLGSDRNIEDHYRFRFGEMYTRDPLPITKSFMDIEVDTIDINYDFPNVETAQCPINAVSIILQHKKQIYTLLLRDKNNPLIAEFEEEVKQGTIFSELNQFIINAVGGYEKADYYGILDIATSFMFYDEENEIDLIVDLFKIINTEKPDFLLTWNMAFDMVYIINRIKSLGYSPEEIICHPDFQVKHCEYRVDRGENFSVYAERGDNAVITSYTVYLDQLIHFASRRKGGEKFLNYTLDYIGEKITGVRKLNYKGITSILGELPRKDYKTFVFYNIMDTIVQYCIEFKVEDIEYVYFKALKNDVRYHKCHRQTVYLTNRVQLEFRKRGFILGNNCNRSKTGPDGDLPGAFVADPLLVKNINKIKIFEIFVMIYELLLDSDFASLYPNIIMTLNNDPSAMIGMIYILSKIHDKENKCNDAKWTRSSAFAEDFASHVWLEFCARWFNFPRYEQLYNDVIYFFTHIMIPQNGCLRNYDNDGLVHPIIYNTIVDRYGNPINDNKDNLTSPFIFENEMRLEFPFIFDDCYDHKENPLIYFNRNEVMEVLDDLSRNPNQFFRY